MTLMPCTRINNNQVYWFIGANGQLTLTLRKYVTPAVLGRMSFD